MGREVSEAVRKGASLRTHGQAKAPAPPQLCEQWEFQVGQALSPARILLPLFMLAAGLTSPAAIAQLVERPLVTGRQALVTSLEPLASMAGMRILQQGGNAFDAAVATAVAVTVVDPRMSSIGGQGFATVYVAAKREVRAINFFGPSPRAATIAALTGKDYSQGYLATPVPSCLRGYWELHKTYGKLSWRQVLEPAIELAEHGFIMTPALSASIHAHQQLLASFPSTAEVLLPHGQAPEPGDLFVQTGLAHTLHSIAGRGADEFYAGEIADRVAAFYKQHDGLITKDDLAAYRPRWVQPISTTYRGYTFYTQPPNSSGIAVLEQLNMLEGFDLHALGHNTPEYLHLVGEVMRLAVADRNRYVGDPDFVHVPMEKLLSKNYAAARRRLIDPHQTMPVATAGDFGAAPSDTHTTHLNVVDAEGNMVALTQTLGAVFGSGVMAGDTGVLFSNQMRHLHLDPKDASRMEPGKRPRSNESPLIVLKDGRPFMALGTPGNDGIWQRLVQVIVNLIDFRMDIQAAITAPRMTYGGTQETGTEIGPVFNVEDRIPEAAMQALRGLGFTVKPVRDDIGRVNGIVIDPRSGFRLGGADPREYGYALGW
jgi:gamma-glutamyltranspeptidase/glutathione hydrolase